MPEKVFCLLGVIFTLRGTEETEIKGTSCSVVVGFSFHDATLICVASIEGHGEGA